MWYAVFVEIRLYSCLEGEVMYQETKKFEKYGKGFMLWVAVSVLIPFLLSFFVQFHNENFESFDAGYFLMVAGVVMIFVVIVLIMVIARGWILESLVQKTAKKARELPYHFYDSIQGDANGSQLMIDLDNGVIVYISAFNPFKIQVFSARRVDGAKTAASAMFGIRFVFYLDGKKISMYTAAIEDHVIDLNSEEGRDAVAEADKFVALLQEAKRVAEGRSW